MEIKKSGFKPNITVSVILAVIMVIALGVFIGRVMEYNEIKKEQSALSEAIKTRLEEIGALEHEYTAEMDDKYIESVAKSKLDLVYPDEVIVYSDIND